MGAERTPYYRADLALIHHEGFAFHTEDCAPGILSARCPRCCPRHGVRADVGQAFGSERRPEGLRTLIGRREA